MRIGEFAERFVTRPPTSSLRRLATEETKRVPNFSTDFKPLQADILEILNQSKYTFSNYTQL